MRFNTFTAICGVLFINSILASTPFEGPHVNLSVGYTKFSATAKTGYVDAFSDDANTSTFAKNSGNIKAGFGYGFNFKDFYHSDIEVYGFYNPLKATSLLEATVKKGTLKRTCAVGAKGTIGYFLQSTILLYGGLALEGSTFKLALEKDGFFNQIQKSRFLYGWGPVAGVKIALSETKSLFLEGSSIFYKNMKISGFHTGDDRSMCTKISPDTLSLNLGLSIKI